MRAVAKYCDEYICLHVCLSVARSSSGMLTIGRIAYRREGVTGVHSASEV